MYIFEHDTLSDVTRTENIVRCLIRQPANRDAINYVVRYIRSYLTQNLLTDCCVFFILTLVVVLKL